MSIEQLTYAALAERLNCSPEAARSLAKRVRLPRQRGHDGKTLVAVDVAEIKHKPLPARSPAGHGPDVATLKAKITELENKFAQLEIVAGGHRADFERERERYDGLMAALLRQTADLMMAEVDATAAREVTARLEGELAALRSRPWWRRRAG